MAGALVVGGVVGGFIGANTAGAGTTAAGVGTTAAGACSVSAVAAHDLPSVVTVSVRNGTTGGTGSGELIDTKGNILTNNHVISAAATGGSISVVYYNGESATATLVGRDPQADVAVIHVDNPAAKPIAIGSSSDLLIGEPVIAIGSPLGLNGSVTSGIVSATDRTVEVPGDNGQTAVLASAIQTDAAINPGNSGGALVDCAGKLIGVPSAGALAPSTEPNGATSTGNIGLGFAIPVDTAMKIADQLISTGTVHHAYFGMSAATIPAGDSADSGGGIYVQEVAPGGPAAGAGLAAGDVITEINGQKATGSDQLLALTITQNPGDKVKVTYQRGGSTADTTLTLGSQP